MTGLYTLNTTDMFTAYGFVPKPGASNPLLTPRKRKPIYSNNWAEIDGAEYDLEAPVRFEDRTFTLRGYITANSELDFHEKYNALKAMFASTGYLVLGSEELGEDYDVNCFYVESKEVNRLTRLKGTDKVYMEIEVELRETQNDSANKGRRKVAS